MWLPCRQPGAARNHQQPVRAGCQAAARVQKDSSEQAEEHVSPPDSQQGRPPVGGTGREEVRESITQACPPQLAGAGCRLAARAV